jgi:hypothetical protein
VNITAGTGLTGTVDTTSGDHTQTLDLDLNSLSTSGTLIGTDSIAVVDGTLTRKTQISSIPLGIFNNDQGWTSNTGDITSVTITAGNGLSGGGSDFTGGVSFNLDLGALTANWNAGSTYTITANDFILGSDIRLKENIKPLDTVGLDIDYVEFNYKTNKDRKRAGVIAQDIEAKYPELVLENEEGIKQVSYIDMLIREVVALKEEVRILKNKI